MQQVRLGLFCSSNPCYQNTIEVTAEATTLSEVLLEIAKTNPLASGQKCVVSLNGCRINEKDYGKVIADFYQKNSVPPCISVFRRDIRYLSDYELKQLREFRDFLDSILD